LSKLRVVEYSPAQEGKAFFGAWVTLVDENDDRLTFRIVGPDEIYGKKDYVSVHAPVVKACLGKSVGEEIVVRTPDSSKVWEIDEIEYQHE